MFRVNAMRYTFERFLLDTRTLPNAVPGLASSKMYVPGSSSAPGIATDRLNVRYVVFSAVLAQATVDAAAATTSNTAPTTAIVKCLIIGLSSFTTRLHGGVGFIERNRVATGALLPHFGKTHDFTRVFSNSSRPSSSGMKRSAERHAIQIGRASC